MIGKPEYPEFRAAVVSWAREHSVTDAAIIEWAQHLSADLADCSRGIRAPVRPSTGLCVRGACSNKTQQKMWWRVGVLESSDCVLEGQLPYGSETVAEVLALVCGLEWADGEEYDGPLYTASHVAMAWWRTKAYFPDYPVPTLAAEMIMKSMAIGYKREIKLWSLADYGKHPFEFAATWMKTRKTGRR